MFQIEKILFPTDLSDATSSLAPLVKQITELFHAELHVISVIANPISQDIISHDLIDIPNFHEYQKELNAMLEEKLRSFVEEFFTDLDKKTTSIVRGDPAEAIIHYSKDNSIDLIIMGSITKPGLVGRIFGGTAHKVAANATCPVMSVNPFKIKK